MLKARNLLILRSAGVATTASFARVGYTLGTLAIFAAPFFAGALSAQPHTITVPFREINHRILIDLEIGGKAATLLFDTGARVSIWVSRDRQTCGLILVDPREKLGLECSHEAPSVAFIPLDEEKIRIDGFLGADVLSKFSSVRIDYRNRVIELIH